MWEALLEAFTCPSTYVLLVTGLIGAISAVMPMLHPKVATIAVTITAILGIILKEIEKN